MKVKAVSMFIDGFYGHFYPGEIKTVSPATADKLVQMKLVEVIEEPNEQATDPPIVVEKKARKNARNRTDQS